ncbi:MAG: hypothetical protein II348_05650 [Clostridia bacterium]|nr:hypothetical protein [Clostridia bacterium]
MKKKLIAALLLTVLMTSLVLTGCSASIMTANGEKMKTGYYSFYVHWQRDYYKEMLKGYGYDITSSMDSYFTQTETVRQAIVSSAKTQYLTFVIVTKKFEELGLSLTEEQTNEIQKQYDEEWIKVYGEKGMKNILKTLKLSKDEFLNLLAVEYKSDALLEYYYGPEGITPITEKDKKDYYNNNYYRFKYILLETTDDKDKALPADEIIYKRNLAEDLYQRVLNGESFEDLIPQYSEDYAKITDKMTAEEKAEAEKSNTAAVTDGLICDKDGIFNRTLYNYYDICVNSKIVSRLEELKGGDVSVVEIDNSIWVIKEYDINEKDSYYEGKEEAIFQSLYGPDISNKYTMWMAELNYEFNDDVLAELDPGTFTDLFSEVYNLEKEDK